MCNTYVSHTYIQPSTSGVLSSSTPTAQYLYLCISQESTLALVRGISCIYSTRPSGFSRFSLHFFFAPGS